MSDFLTGRSGIGLHQRRKFFELRNQYELSGEDGTPTGKVEQVNQSPLTIVARVISGLDVALPITLEVSDASARTVLTLHKPWFRYRVTVSDSGGAAIGQIVKRVRLGKAVFSILDDNGEEIGQVRAENWRARDFRIEDASQREIARVTKQWRGLLTEAFTDADSYAVTFEPTTAEPMRSLALGAALAVDITMKQKDSGGGLPI